jgi:DNA-directed RNA polymerase beta subunit
MPLSSQQTTAYVRHISSTLSKFPDLTDWLCLTPRTPRLQADRRCCEDNPDALTHHEVLLPGHLMLKFLREQLETALDAFRQQVGEWGGVVGQWVGCCLAQT